MKKEEIGVLREKAKQIRLVVCDMDGTLLDSREEIPPENLRALARLRERGVAVSLATGRVFGSIDYYVRKLAITVPVITANGAELADPVTGEAAELFPISGETAGRLIAFLRAQNTEGFAALCRDGVITERGMPHDIRYTRHNAFTDRAGCRRFPVSYFDGGCGVGGRTVLKVNYYPRSREQAAEILRFVRETCGLSVTTADGTQCESVRAGVDKGTGLTALARRLGVPREHCMAFGDFDNDLPAFRAAGFPVAMGNARPAVKRAALYITGTNEAGGVAGAVGRLFFGEDPGGTSG